jgi:dephospho-CoA kinase
MVYRVGLTGGIASGKSVVASAFERLGVPVIDTDGLAREVVLPGTLGLSAVAERFGPSVLQPDGTLDRRALRGLIFSDPVARRDLEGLLHPRIQALLAQRVADVTHPYCVLAIPLLVEGGGRIPVDRVLVVDCPRETQLARLLRRDGETLAGAEAILAAQATREARLARADDVIDNSGPLTALDGTVGRLHEQYLRQAAAAEKVANLS